MKPAQRILVLVDERPESLAGLSRAVELAARTRVSIDVLSVLEPLDEELARWPVWEDRAELERARLDAEIGWQKARVASVTGGCPVRVFARSGRPCATAIRLALEEAHDLSIVTARGHAARRRGFVGSSVLWLARRSPCPVWVVAPGLVSAEPKVLAVVDPGEKSDRARRRLATQVLRHAEEWAALDHAELHVLYVPQRLAPGTLTTRLATAKQELREVTSVLERAPDRVRITPGFFEDEVADYVAAQRIDRVVVGSPGQTGIRGLLAGDAAEDVLTRVDAEVLLVRPGNSDSPPKFGRPRAA